MKIRSGFVSNSSSSSFLIQSNKKSREEFVEKVFGSLKEIFSPEVVNDVWEKSDDIHEGAVDDILWSILDQLVMSYRYTLPNSSVSMLGYDRDSFFKDLFDAQKFIPAITEDLIVSLYTAEKEDYSSYPDNIAKAISLVKPSFDFSKYSTVVYSDNEDDFDADMEHKVMPMLNCFRVSSH